MRFWFHEITGWLLILLGLYIFYEVYEIMLVETHYIESAPWVLVGIFVFRGGIQLLKSALAARVCSRAETRIQEERRADVARTNRPGSGRTAPLGQT
jgi:hypothetical protein